MFDSNGVLDTALDVGIFVGYYSFYIVSVSPSIIRLYGRVPVAVGYTTSLSAPEVKKFLPSGCYEVT